MLRTRRMQHGPTTTNLVKFVTFFIVFGFVAIRTVCADAIPDQETAVDVVTDAKCVSAGPPKTKKTTRKSSYFSTAADLGAIDDSAKILIHQPPSQLYFDDALAKRIAERFGDLQVLVLPYCRSLTDEGVEDLAKLAGLKVLRLGFAERLTATAAESLVEMSNLQVLDVSYCGGLTTDQPVKKLLGISGLKHLLLARHSGGGCTSEIIGRLESSKSSSKVYLTLQSSLAMAVRHNGHPQIEIVDDSPWSVEDRFHALVEPYQMDAPAGSDASTQEVAIDIVKPDQGIVQEETAPSKKVTNGHSFERGWLKIDTGYDLVLPAGAVTEEYDGDVVRFFLTKSLRCIGHPPHPMKITDARRYLGIASQTKPEEKTCIVSTFGEWANKGGYGRLRLFVLIPEGLEYNKSEVLQGQGSVASTTIDRKDSRLATCYWYSGIGPTEGWTEIATHLHLNRFLAPK